MTKMHVWAAVGAFAAVVAIGAGFRLIDLDERPFHGDEANQAHKAGVLLEEGEYRYDPEEHHGPTLYYFSLPFLWASGASTFAETDATTFRLLPAVFSIALVLLVWPFGSHLGRWELLFAGLLVALSPSLAYYGRYFIQETLLVFFTFAAILSGWRYLQHPSWPWALVTGLCLGLMHATKETCIILYAAMAAGIAGCWLWNRLDARAPWEGGVTLSSLSKKHIGLIVGAGLVVSVVLFSSFFTHWRGPLDSILTYTHYVERAEGAEIHEHPWHFYWQTLLYWSEPRAPVWSEALIVGLAVLGVGAAVFPHRKDAGLHLLRFLALFTIVTALVFTLIPYKTPWNMLTFVYGMALLGGPGLFAAVRWLRHWSLQGILIVAVAAATVQLGMQAHRTVFEYAADFENPYAYGHTTGQISRLVDSMEDIAAAAPDGKETIIFVIEPEGDYWPLPWYLREFSNVGYFEDIPDRIDVPIIITKPEYGRSIEEFLEGEYRTQMHGLRPGVSLLMFVEDDLWEAFMEHRRAERAG